MEIHQKIFLNIKNYHLSFKSNKKIPSKEMEFETNIYFIFTTRELIRNWKRSTQTFLTIIDLRGGSYDELTTEVSTRR